MSGLLILKAALGHVWNWLGGLTFWQIVAGILAIIAIIQHFQLLDARHDRDAWHKQFDKEHSGRLADRKAYSDAQARAEAANKAHVAATEQQYRKVSEDAKDGYARDHAELVRLRQKSAAPQGSSSGAGSSEGGGTAPRADGHGLSLSSDEYLQAQEIELRLMHLQNYVEGLLNVDPNER